MKESELNMHANIVKASDKLAIEQSDKRIAIAIIKNRIKELEKIPLGGSYCSNCSGPKSEHCSCNLFEQPSIIP